MNADNRTDFERVCSENDIIRYNKKSGGCFFSAETMQFFNSRIESGAVHYDGKVFFLTSEKFDHKARRHYTIREMNESGRIVTKGNFNNISTLQQAIKKLNEITILRAQAEENLTHTCDFFKNRG